ncbi:MAG: hypothetical protein RBT78_13940 [Kiritimatiellia bacterium]|nr:hypothetical protein [Kiritimatiellia bacterium]
MLKRWWLRSRAFRAAQPELEACRATMERLFGGPVTWRRTGGCGRDVVCLVSCGGKPVGVLRRVMPVVAHASGGPRKGKPVAPLGPEEKIEREWQAYAVGAPHGLTPVPLWRAERTLICAYVDGAPLKKEAERSGTYLDVAAAVLPRIAHLHRLGVTHLDMSLANILAEETGRRVFVDFEYGPAAGLTFDQQCLYDYLRLLESVWKFLDLPQRGRAGRVWDAALRAHAPDRVRAAAVAPLRPALTRILAAPELEDFWKRG